MVKFSELIFHLAMNGSIPIALCVEEHRYTKEYEEMEKISMELHDFLKKKKEDKKEDKKAEENAEDKKEEKAEEKKEEEKKAPRKKTLRKLK